ncbi:MAG: hypothetical protein ACSHYB_14750 [Roseibacillus sp.]
MKNYRFWLFALLILLPTSLWAGSRGVSLAFLDATTGERSKASLRLAELLEKDMRSLYLDPQLAEAFPWSEQDLELQVLKSDAVQISFDRLLNTKGEKQMSALFEKMGNPDGLVVFFHDAEGGYARLKLYSWDGTEALLIRLPLEGKESAMPDSLLKWHRRGALIAMGAAVRWSP